MIGNRGEGKLRERETTMEAGDSSEKKKVNFKGKSLIDVVFSWSLSDILNDDLYKDQVFIFLPFFFEFLLAFDFDFLGYVDKSALLEDVLEKSELGSVDFQRFLFPMVPHRRR